jgi:hypothetical protein
MNVSLTRGISPTLLQLCTSQCNSYHLRSITTLFTCVAKQQLIVVGNRVTFTRPDAGHTNTHIHTAQHTQHTHTRTRRSWGMHTGLWPYVVKACISDTFKVPPMLSKVEFQSKVNWKKGAGGLGKAGPRKEGVRQPMDPYLPTYLPTYLPPYLPT